MPRSILSHQLKGAAANGPEEVAPGFSFNPHAFSTKSKDVPILAFPSAELASAFSTIEVANSVADAVGSHSAPEDVGGLAKTCGSSLQARRNPRLTPISTDVCHPHCRYKAG